MDTKKNKFLSNKGFVLFSILALIVVLVAIFAPVLSGGVDPTAGNLADAIMAPDANISSVRIKWGGIFSPGFCMAPVFR